MWLANMGVGGPLAWKGDFLCQYMEVNKATTSTHEEFDWDRAFAFSAFGAFYMGGFANFVYSRAIPWVISRKIVSKSLSLNLHSNARKDFLKRGFVGSIVDNTLHAPLFYLPSYFIFTDVIAAPCKDESRILLNELPKVKP